MFKRLIMITALTLSVSAFAATGKAETSIQLEHTPQGPIIRFGTGQVIGFGANGVAYYFHDGKTEQGVWKKVSSGIVVKFTSGAITFYDQPGVPPCMSQDPNTHELTCY